MGSHRIALMSRRISLYDAPMKATRFKDVFSTRYFPLIGMVHLQALPGAPRRQGSMESIIDAARRDAAILVAAGFDGIMVENFGDAPFFPERVPSVTVAALTACCLEIKAELDGQLLGVNVLRNDASAALGIAAVVGADLVRVNVHCGAMWTDQGLIQGHAHETTRERAALGAPVVLLADILVKHAQPPAPVKAADAAREVVHRGLADGIIISGRGTGAPIDPRVLEAAAEALPGCPILIGSGLSPELLPALAARATGAIVGSWLKVDGEVSNPVDPERARRLVEARDRFAESRA